MASFQAKIGWKKGREREKIQIIVSFRSYPMRNRKFQTNSKNFQKKLLNTIMAPFQAKIRGETPRKRENKNYRFVPFPPAA